MNTIVKYSENFDTLVKQFKETFPCEQLFFIIDRVVFDKCQSIFEGYNYLLLENPEAEKQIGSIDKIVTWLINSNARRDCFLVGIGGGATLDITGFIASIYQRGIRHAFIPTTLLSMVDASLGGKAALNLLYKNSIGTFWLPRFTFICLEYLKFLDDMQRKSGLGEIVKMALLKDMSILDEYDRNPNFTLELIQKIVKLKMSYVHKDFYDRGIRKQLNFGHTFGHIIEKNSNFSIPHGIAVANGIYMMLRFEQEVGYEFNHNIINQVYELLQKYDLYNGNIQNKYNEYKLLLFSFDKKNLNNTKALIFLKDIQKPFIYYITRKEYEYRLADLKIPYNKSLIQRDLILLAYNDDFEQLETYEQYCCSEDTALLYKALLQYNKGKKAFYLTESATSLKCLVIFLLVKNGIKDKSQTYTIHGKKGLFLRPLDSFFELFKRNNVTFSLTPTSITVTGSLKTLDYNFVDLKSSQFVSAIILAAPFVKKRTLLSFPRNISSLSFIELTIKLLREDNIKIDEFNTNDKMNVCINGNTSKFDFKPHIEEDLGMAANMWVLSIFLKNSFVTINKYKSLKTSLQVDKKIIDILIQANANMTINDNAITFATSADLKPLNVDLTNMLDLAPILFVYASLVKAPSVFTGFENLKYKESDRLNCVINELKKINTIVDLKEESLTISKCELECINDVVFDDYNDHRLFFAFSVLCKIIGYGSVKKSKSYNKTWSKFDIELNKGLNEKNSKL
jgi:3-dehydroquinate synthase